MKKLDKDIEQLKQELFDMVDEYYPKIEPIKGNKGRGEAMVIVATAIIGVKRIIAENLKGSK